MAPSVLPSGRTTTGSRRRMPSGCAASFEAATSCSSTTRSRRVSSPRWSSSGPVSLAMPRRLRWDERVDGARLGVPSPLRRGCARTRLLACVIRAELDRSRVVAGDPSFDRSVRAQDQDLTAVRGARPAQRGRATRSRRHHPDERVRRPAQVVREGPAADPKTLSLSRCLAGTGSRIWAACSRASSGTSA